MTGLIENFFDGKCDIYHCIEGTDSPGWGISETVVFTYPENPDIKDKECHFHRKGQAVSLEQGEPVKILTAEVKLSLPSGTDIRMNDMVVDKKNGLSFTAGLPQDVRGHHRYVYLAREGTGRAV